VLGGFLYAVHLAWTFVAMAVLLVIASVAASMIRIETNATPRRAANAPLVEAAVEPSIGDIEEPSFTQPWSGVITVKGWAVDFQGISSIDIKVNGQVVGQATLGGPRLDVAELYPGYPSAKSAGWTFSYDTRNTNDGRVTFEVWVHDLVGDETLIGEGQAIIDNRDHP
jgi:hypothetical protein